LIFYLKGSEAELDTEELDALHIGEFTASYRTAYKSEDRGFEGGFWEFAGQMTNPPDGDNDMAIVFLEGSAEIECGGQSYSVTAGDLIVFEGRVAAKNYRSDGFRAIYLRRFHGVPPTDEERARARAGGPKPEGEG
jgi:uncharacterized cupin superfamily protein